METLKAQRVKKVCAGTSHSLALTEAHEVFTWGCNNSGQLGRITADEKLRFPK